MLSCIVGLIALFVEAVPIFLVAGLEAVSGLLLLGGGIVRQALPQLCASRFTAANHSQAFAIGLRGVSCSLTDDAAFDRTLNCNLINQGSTTVGGTTGYGIGIPESDDKNVYTDRLLGNCKKATVDEAFQFVACGFVLLTLFLCYLFLRNGRPSGKRSYV